MLIIRVLPKKTKNRFIIFKTQLQQKFSQSPFSQASTSCSNAVFKHSKSPNNSSISVWVADLPLTFTKSRTSSTIDFLSLFGTFFVEVTVFFVRNWTLISSELQLFSVVAGSCSEDRSDYGFVIIKLRTFY